MSNSKLNISAKVNVILSEAGMLHWEKFFIQLLNKKTTWDKNFDMIYANTPHYKLSDSFEHTFQQVCGRRKVFGENTYNFELSELMFVFGSEMQSSTAMFEYSSIEFDNDDCEDDN